MTQCLPATEQTYVQAIYSKIAPHFDSTRGYIWSWIRGYLQELTSQTYGTRILDIGCGNGRNMKACPPGCQVTGIDLCPELVQICQRQGLSALVADMCHLPFTNKSFDLLLMIASFHHLSTPERRLQCLQECYRVLAPGGHLVFSVWSINQPVKTRRTFETWGDQIVPWTQKDTTYQRYYYIFRHSEILDLAKRAGFHFQKHHWDCGNEIYHFTRLS